MHHKECAMRGVSYPYRWRRTICHSLRISVREHNFHADAVGIYQACSRLTLPHWNFPYFGQRDVKVNEIAKTWFIAQQQLTLLLTILLWDNNPKRKSEK